MHHTLFQRAAAWIFQARHRQMASTLRCKLANLFNEHPQTAGESYVEHMWFTFTMAARFAFTALAIVLHGFFPFLCTHTASNQIARINHIMSERAVKQRETASRKHKGIPLLPGYTKRIAIIGGGFSGAMVLAQCVKRAKTPLVIDWFEPLTPGEGAAYSTHIPEHVLNVRADRMGAWADDPEHFFTWLKSSIGQETLSHLWPHHTVLPETYVPRCIYAAYIKSIIADALRDAALKNIVVHTHVAEVTDIGIRQTEHKKLTLRFLQDGFTAEILVDNAVLATGNLPPREHAFISSKAKEMPEYIGAGWNIAASEFASRIAQLPADATIAIIGTGLTAIDAILTLQSLKYQGNILAFSRNGLLPAVHETGKPYPAWKLVKSPEQAPHTVLELFVTLRQEIMHAQQKGYSWQSVMDSLRPVTPTLWKNLHQAQKQRFFTRLFTWWNVHRHRMAPEIHEKITALRQQGKLAIIAGKIQHIDADAHGLRVTYTKRRAMEAETLRPAFIINCTGPEYDVAASGNALLTLLCKHGMLKTDALKAGVGIHPDQSAQGSAEHILYPIGPLTIGEHLECTAVPELRQHARNIADRITEL